MRSLHGCPRPAFPPPAGRARLAAPLALALGLATFLLAPARGRAEGRGNPGPTVPARSAVMPEPGRMVPPYPYQVKEFAFIQVGNYFHVFWMRHDVSVPADSTERDLGHAITRDFIHWTQLAPVLAARPGKWDSFHIWAPAIYQSGNTFYLYYTGVTKVPYAWNTFQRIGLATSTDLVNWTRYDTPVLTARMLPWADADSSTLAGCQFRDPFVMADPNVPGRMLLYFVGVPTAASSQLIIGSAQSSNLTTWSDLGPLWCSDAAHYWGWCESPHLLRHGPLWYLFTTTNSGHPLSFRTAASPTADSTAWSGSYRVFNMVGQDTLSNAWFGSEALSTTGHDYFGLINSATYTLEFYEMIWGTPPNFTLGSPTISADADAGPASALGLAIIRPAGTGPCVLLRATLPEATEGRVELFDVSGRRVRTLRSGPFPPGETVVAWDARLAGGEMAPDGIYFASLSTPMGRSVARVPVVR